MDRVEGIIHNRRSLRALKAVQATPGQLADIAEKLVASASLAPSADNSQPWRFVAVYESPQIDEIRNSLSPLNKWAR